MSERNLWVAAQAGRPPDSPFAWGVGRRLAVVTLLIAGLWLAVAAALDWPGAPG
ncbi:MAG: hypothetical protein H7838_10080 [Magnetococcus sp. DMHC-8]